VKTTISKPTLRLILAQSRALGAAVKPRHGARYIACQVGKRFFAVSPRLLEWMSDFDTPPAMEITVGREFFGDTTGKFNPTKHRGLIAKAFATEGKRTSRLSCALPRIKAAPAASVLLQIDGGEITCVQRVAKLAKANVAYAKKIMAARVLFSDENGKWLLGKVGKSWSVLFQPIGMLGCAPAMSNLLTNGSEAEAIAEAERVATPELRERVIKSQWAFACERAEQSEREAREAIGEEVGEIVRPPAPTVKLAAAAPSPEVNAPTPAVKIAEPCPVAKVPAQEEPAPAPVSMPPPAVEITEVAPTPIAEITGTAPTAPLCPINQNHENTPTKLLRERGARRNPDGRRNVRLRCRPGCRQTACGATFAPRPRSRAGGLHNDRRRPRKAGGIPARGREAQGSQGGDGGGREMASARGRAAPLARELRIHAGHPRRGNYDMTPEERAEKQRERKAKNARDYRDRTPERQREHRRKSDRKRRSTPEWRAAVRAARALMPKAPRKPRAPRFHAPPAPPPPPPPAMEITKKKPKANPKNDPVTGWAAWTSQK
jgi:hypothetical protein